MPTQRNRSFRNGLSTVGLLLALSSALVVTGAVQHAGAQQTNKSSGGKVTPPPLPNGSAQVHVKPGMSEEEWEKAYKETGRPKFSQRSVKRSGGNVERD
ncbi:hypothetical protein C7H84_10780 [Burkholderia sp. Nafp2/4-1b]|uniref:hypothetical protein n=1 Tax=Burkholderia sp. Nafp2/4-1b TaxID=2116686 RepID=UPI000EF88F1A|nr:hypothetical protein [Burkholderia sp. Nafp2/4-1b]RKU03634.1 hypothetical protein C7H84_10780 [Burkholderia sp. Nafp2/4-1b]